MESKKDRSENWTQEEKSLLVQCVNEKKSMIESKSNDIRAVKGKKLAWMEIKDVFRANGYVRDVNRIKEQWRRLKCAAKKNVSVYERERKKTGGGSPPQQPVDLEYLIKNICPEDFTKDTSKYDTDGISGQEEATEVPASTENAVEMVLDAETGLFLEPITSEILQTTSSSSALPSKCNSSKQRQKRKISTYEEKLLGIEKQRLQLELQHKTEIHEEVMFQLNLERKRKQMDLEASTFKRHREEIEYKLAQEKINKNNLC